MDTQTFVLLVLLNMGHWLADYTHLSTPWMLGAKRLGKPLLPILSHAGVHALFAFLITLLVTDNFRLAIVAHLFQLVTHFIIDVLKGRLNGWVPSLQSPANPYHWYVFGADQLLHQIVLIIIVFGSTNG